MLKNDNRVYEKWLFWRVAQVKHDDDDGGKTRVGENLFILGHVGMGERTNFGQTREIPNHVFALLWVLQSSVSVYSERESDRKSIFRELC